MEQILRSHFARYPAMTPQDAVKLLYQSAFGPGHLIADPAYAQRRLEEEYTAVPAGDGPLLEDIGGGFARLYLPAAKGQNLPVSAIFARFSAASTAECGGMPAFAAGLILLEGLARQGAAPFSAEALSQYLAPYRAQGCPMVSHSEVYRQHYHPAYRVVCL